MVSKHGAPNDSDLEPEIQDESEEDEEPQQITYSITSYGADYPVDGLVKRLHSRDILVPQFQRQYVWSLTQASRFIESLLLGLPVPGIFLSRENDSRKLLVIDGQQRLLTLSYFYDGIFADSKKEFALRGVQNQFKNSTYKTLREEDRRRLDDSIIHATIIQQEEPEEDVSSVYHIFERLNTGGTLLTPQEIRACVYHGSFNSLLKDLNATKAWRQIFGQESRRMRDSELILRFLALYYNREKYERPMNEFLNKFMKNQKAISEEKATELKDLFVETVETIHGSIGATAFRPKKALNAAVFDSVMIGVANRVSNGPILDSSEITNAYNKLILDPDFIQSTETSTASEESVKRRINLAIKAFSILN